MRGVVSKTRLAVVEDRIDDDLAVGRHAELVPELDQLVSDHPLRERLYGQLMRALYASGRAGRCARDLRASAPNAQRRSSQSFQSYVDDTNHRDVEMVLS